MTTIQSITYESTSLFDIRDSSLGPDKELLAILAVEKESQGVNGWTKKGVEIVGGGISEENHMEFRCTPSSAINIR